MRQETWLLALLIIIGIIGVIHIVHGIVVDRKIVYVEETFSSPKILPNLDGYTIAFVSDVHRLDVKRLTQVIEHIQQREVDVLLLGGDFATGEKKTAHDLALLAQIKPADGIYGVKGNHDSKNKLFHQMREQGMVPLANQGVHLREGLYLAGSEDYRRGNPHIAQAVKGADEGDFCLLLSHNPDVSMLPGGDLVDLVLSGHIHGGELSFFGLWAPLVPFESRHGWRFKGGWSQSSFGTPVFVGNGLGNHFPIRAFCPPQVIYMTLRTEQ